MLHVREVYSMHNWSFMQGNIGAARAAWAVACINTPITRRIPVLLNMYIIKAQAKAHTNNLK